ncbi:hypothetical protein [Aquimarina pacifica]|uniref:hypothetical protein n=1 Tax=Aquimarina pacifica TaxID=1296415 RepID=UPI0004700A0C|nr:hypothetical protein [Aquimarina pacifica]
MKKILDLKGVQELSKKQQQRISGSATAITCCSRSKCRISFPGGSICEPGDCSTGICRLLY